jgi:hypothetical protein
MEEKEEVIKVKTPQEIKKENLKALLIAFDKYNAEETEKMGGAYSKWLAITFGLSTVV